MHCWRHLFDAMDSTQSDAISAGGEFVLDEDGDCQWDGAWTYADV